MVCSLSYFMFETDGNIQMSFEKQTITIAFSLNFRLIWKVICFNNPYVKFSFFCVSVDLFCQILGFFFLQARWHSHPLLLLTFKACSLLCCGVNSKWLTMIKQKMKLEWHYLKIYLKPQQVSVCSSISVGIYEE